MTDNLFQRLEENTTRHPRKAAFVFKRGTKWESFTFQQLFDLSERLARGLSAIGLHAGQRAALMTPPSVDFFALAFALLKTGIIPVMVDPAIGLANVTACLKESKPEIFIGNTLTHAIRRLYGWGRETVKHNISIARVERLTFNVQRSAPFATNSASSPAAIIYTSGSTGLPKGAIYTHENFAAQLDMLSAAFDIQPDEIDQPAFPLFALIDCLLGVTAVIPDMRFPPPAKVDSAKATDAILRFNVTNMFASPIMLDHLADYATSSGYQLPSLKRIITAGAPAPVIVLEKSHKMLSSEARLFGIYGATESLPITVIDSKEILNETRHLSARRAGVCIGKPVDGACVRIIPISDTAIWKWDDSLEMPTNEVGEITVKGRAVTQAYIGREEVNQLAKIDDRGETIHRMGDLGYFDERGRLWYCGRKSHRVETAHGTFFTEQIEGIFNAHPLVYRTALVGVDGEPVLWVELESHAQNADKEIIKQELFELGKNHLQAVQVKTFLFAKIFPTDVRHNSKIIREKLATLAVKLVGRQ